MTPQQFISKWGPGGPAFDLNERQGAQPHFMDLCELLGVPTPGSEGDYLFEKNTLVLGDVRGYADVFKRNHFAWENKAPGRNLDTALKQLLTYSLALSNPPILVVSDRLTIRIHTQFNGHPSETYSVALNELDQPEKQALLRRIWLAPESFRPKTTSRDITNSAAKSFATLAEGLRRRNAKPDDSSETQEARANQVAHFLTQCLFSFFAEDVGLLPDRMFERLIVNKRLTADRLNEGLRDLFQAMQSGGMFGADDIPWFNGGLFRVIDVPALSIMDVTELRNAAALNWSAIDVSIFGTLFERGLDPAKRSQLGAHYTDPATIMRIVTPVIERPLLQLWELVAQDLRSLMAKSRKKGDASYRAARERFVKWLDELAAYRILDPACGSGNFLFLGLKTLKDVEHRSHIDAHALGLEREAELVTGPHNMLGIELNEYAAELARVTVWIGELQWRMAHGYEFKTNPVLEPLDHIECRDALLSFVAVDGDGSLSHRAGSLAAGSQERAGQMLEPHTLRFLKSAQPSAPPAPGSGEPTFAVVVKPSGPLAMEAQWPKASVVIGNPPFLGGSKKRRELGDAYFEALDTVFKGRVPGGADLVCYWFDKALKAIETNGLGAAGLVATQSIRSGSNRVVLEAIRQKETRIFDAWSDEPWVNDGAAVRVSLVSFGWGECCFLNGQRVDQINAELGSSTQSDMTAARALPDNANVSFEGTKKYGDFDISGKLARDWLRLPNPNEKSNSEIVKPWRNGQDVTRRPSDTWVIDFGPHMREVDAALYEQPFSYLVQHVKPERMKVRRDRTKRLWWIHEEARVSLREGLSELKRFVATPRVAKHRFFVFLDATVLPDTRLNAITRADDTTFGILSSHLHEAWSLANASIHGDGDDGGRPTYNAKSCFETYPFPAGLTPADTAHQQTETLETGAQIPAGLAEGCLNLQLQNKTSNKAGVGQRLAVTLRSEAKEPPAFAPLPPGQSAAASTNLKQLAIQIANAAKHLNDLRNNWLNPSEWTYRVPEVIPLGMDKSPYPDRIEPKPGISEADLKALQKRTLTNLYNLRPQWLTHAHDQLDQAVAIAYGWVDYSAAMPDQEILKRLLALNLERSDASIPKDTKK